MSETTNPRMEEIYEFYRTIFKIKATVGGIQKQIEFLLDQKDRMYNEIDRLNKHIKYLTELTDKY